ncbi:hypothetical protein [Maricaulis sp.]|uniref:hypothetical protein n=1 Tax=Maricaulis sp. TaxID=1486257 RepID=UPI002B2712B0|nr:hypothetical protein [Maricaulis sp.]
MRWTLAFTTVGLAIAVALVAWPRNAAGDESPDLFAHQPAVSIAPGDWDSALADRFVAASREASQPVPADNSPLGSITLVGTIEDDRGGWALLMQAGELTALAIGSELHGYVLVDLTPEEAVFERDGSRVSIARGT